MPLFEIHIHNHVSLDEVLKRLTEIIKNQNKMAKSLDDLKAKLAVSDAKIDIIMPAVDGLTADIAFIKAKLDAGEGGIDAAGVAELSAVVDAQVQKLSDAATKLADLDAQTDSGGTTESATE